MKRIYPHLGDLFMAHFHQDWAEIYDDLDETVADYISPFRPHDRTEFVAELDKILATETIDEALFERIGDPSIDITDWGMTPREWIQRIRDQVAESLRQGGEGRRSKNDRPAG